MTSDHQLPLSGKTIVLTRAQTQQAEACEMFKAIGALVLELPSLIIGPPDNWSQLDDALSELDSFHWIIFSSSNGVKAVQNRLSRIGSSLGSLPSGLRIAAVGRKTAKCLEKLGVLADFVPPEFIAESLIQNFPVSGLGLRMLLPRVQSGGRNLLSEAFSEGGAKVVEVPAYESRCPDDIPVATLNALINETVDVIAFTSSKTVLHAVQLMRKHCGSQWQEKLSRVKFISIGPQTSKSCQQYLQRVDQEAEPHDIDGLVLACTKAMC